jgi:uncharacterized caspase-like protein
MTSARLANAAVAGAAAAAVVCLALAGGAAAAAPAPASPPAPEAVLYTIAIGYNGVPPGIEGLAPLRFADDDAASVFRFVRELGPRSYLLTIADKDTQRRFPRTVPEARPPSMAELQRVVAELGAQVQADRAAGKAPAVLLFYSGHGTRAADGSAALTLIDGTLTQAALYEEVLAKLPARLVHLLVDACHAEAVVRPRDLQAQAVDVAPADVASYLHQKTIDRFPNVGVIVASTSSAQAHEWDAYQSGIFTHEVLSGLRGAADVDGNGRIEYSELGAFLAAANREVLDPRARLKTVVRPPRVSPRATLVDLSQAKGAARLKGRPSFLGAFFVEDAQGSRLADLRSELGARVELLLPADEWLYVRSALGEAELRLGRGQSRAFEELVLRRTSTQARGAIESSLERGLFAAQFGPSYYRGYVDRTEDIVPVAVAPIDVLEPPGGRGGLLPGRRGPGGYVAAGVAGSLALGAGLFGALAWDAKRDYDGTNLQRPAAEASDRYARYGTMSWGLALGAVVAAGVALYLLGR